MMILLALALLVSSAALLGGSNTDSSPVVLKRHRIAHEVSTSMARLSSPGLEMLIR